MEHWSVEKGIPKVRLSKTCKRCHVMWREDEKEPKVEVGYVERQ